MQRSSLTKCLFTSHITTRRVGSVSKVTIEAENVVDPGKTTSEICNKTNETIQELPPKQFKSPFKVLSEDSARFNDYGIQMIPKSMADHLFGKRANSSVSKNMQQVSRARSELEKHGLMSNIKQVSDVNFSLPKLEGDTIEKHFYNIGESQSAPYRELVLKLCKEVPKVPTKWEMEAGWTKYTEGNSCTVDFPEENAIIFDVEVCCSEGQMPTMAAAVSDKAWYAWVSQDLVNDGKNSKKNHYTTDCLIPLESRRDQKAYSFTEEMLQPRLVVGHNVSYDRARVKEQYWLERTGLRFLDTMSMHVSVSGVTSYQKNMLKAGLAQDDEWSKLSSLNSLSKVHNLYCGSEVSKDEREVFVTGTLADVKNNFQSLMSYCASDVLATHNILCKLFPIYLSRFPHPVSLAGVLELGLAYLPINSNWNQYIQDCNETYNDLDKEAKMILNNLASKDCQLLHNDEYKKNLWMWDQDWTVRKLCLKKTPIRLKKESKLSEKFQNNKNPSNPNEVGDETEYDNLTTKFQYLMDLGSMLPVRLPKLPGYPAWYTKLCPKPSAPDWIPGPQFISTGMQIAPKLLRLTWKSMPLHYVRGHGWGMLVPFKTDIELENASEVPLPELVQHCHSVESDLLCSCNKYDSNKQTVKYHCDKNNLKQIESGENGKKFCRADLGSGCGLIKLPHKDGKHLNVGNPLARDYIHKFSEGSCGSGDVKTERLIEISRMLSYWRNNRERVECQLAVWLSKKEIPSFMSNEKELGSILPQVVVCGTLTRRAVEPTWMTASNALGERVGSELRAMIQAPPSYRLVGADVDSQELWIASVIGDTYSNNDHGSTPFGWMTLSGQKSNGTDMHSVTAKAIGISRNHAKVINYARIYGAGQPFAEHLLKQFNPNMSASEARQKASKMFSMTKGKRLFVLKNNVLPSLQQRAYNKFGAKDVCLLYGKNVEELFEKPRWIGGTESAMFNRLEEIASSPEPKTPFLKGRLSRALEPRTDSDDKFLPTRINWVVQSGAVDFLHLMLVSMRWLLGPERRFCLSFHDEVRYLVPRSDQYRAALALHVTNLYSRAFCINQLGITDVPRSVAFFSSVEIDSVLRKEADHDCKTPSNPFGLAKGYGIPPGESLDIEEAVKKSKGVVGIPSFRRKL